MRLKRLMPDYTCTLRDYWLTSLKTTQNYWKRDELAKTMNGLLFVSQVVLYRVCCGSYVQTIAIICIPHWVVFLS